MTDNIFDGLRGYIEYPCGCKTKILVYDDAHGKASIQCPVCRKYAVFNYDSMTAVMETLWKKRKIQKQNSFGL